MRILIPKFWAALLVCIMNLDLSAQQHYILVVDVQPAFYANTKRATEAESMIRIINQLIAQTDTGKVIYIKATGNVLTISNKGIRSIPMDPAPKLDENLSIVNQAIFTKNQGDAFLSDALLQYISTHQATDFIITGLLAEKCVYTTAIGGKKRGFNITVVPEAIMSKSYKQKNRTLENMKTHGIHVIPLHQLDLKK